MLVHWVEQQDGLEAQILATHGSQPDDSGPPTTHFSWAQVGQFPKLFSTLAPAVASPTVPSPKLFTPAIRYQ